MTKRVTKLSLPTRFHPPFVLSAANIDSIVLADVALYSAYALAPRAVDFLLAGTGPSVTSVVGSVVQVAFVASVYGVKDYATAASFLDNFNELFQTAEVRARLRAVLHVDCACVLPWGPPTTARSPPSLQDVAIYDADLNDAEPGFEFGNIELLKVSWLGQSALAPRLLPYARLSCSMPLIPGLAPACSYTFAGQAVCCIRLRALRKPRDPGTVIRF